MTENKKIEEDFYLVVNPVAPVGFGKSGSFKG